MNGKNLKIIKFSTTKRNSFNKTLKNLYENLIPIKKKEIKKNHSINKKNIKNSILLQLIDNINNTEKQLKKENQKLIENELYKHRNIKKNNDKMISSEIKSKKNKSIKIVKMPPVSHKKLTKILKNSEKKILPLQQSSKITIIQIPIKRNKVKNEEKNIKEEKYKEIINYTNNFYKDCKQSSIKSIDIPTNTNSDISSINDSIFINYKLGKETYDICESELKTINKLNQRSKIRIDKNNNKNEEIIYFNEEKKNINNCKTIKLNNIIHKKLFY